MVCLLALLLAAAPIVGTASPHAAEARTITDGKAAGAPPDSANYVVSTRYTYQWVSDIQAWHNRQLSFELPLPAGTFVSTITQQRRFGQSEVSGGAQYWAELWGDSYGRVNASYAPNAVITSQLRLGGSLYQVIGTWELTGFYEWRRYAGTRIHMIGPQIGWYTGNWYLRLRTSVLNRGDRWFALQRAAARYYLGSPDTYLDGQVGYGRTVEFVDAISQNALTVSQSYFGTLRLHHFLTDHVGLSISATYSEKKRRQVGASLGLMARW